MAGELLLYRYTDALNEILVNVLPLQLFLKLRRKHRQKFGIAGDERAFGVRDAKHDRVTSNAPDDRATKVALNGFYVLPGLYKLHAKRRQARTCSVASDREYPSEGTFDQYRRRDLICQKPAELDSPLFAMLCLQDLFPLWSTTMLSE